MDWIAARGVTACQPSSREGRILLKLVLGAGSVLPFLDHSTHTTLCTTRCQHCSRRPSTLTPQSVCEDTTESHQQRRPRACDRPPSEPLIPQNQRVRPPSLLENTTPTTSTSIVAFRSAYKGLRASISQYTGHTRPHTHTTHGHGDAGHCVSH